jgi:hypothetical protein
LVTQGTSQKVLWREGLHFRIRQDPAAPPRLINQLQTAAMDDVGRRGLVRSHLGDSASPGDSCGDVQAPLRMILP